MKSLNLACSVTKSHLKEFLFLKFSAESFHDCFWYLSCDDYCYEYLRHETNCDCQNLNLQNGKVFGNNEEIDNFFGVIEGKFEAARRCIKDRGWALLVDTDIVFTNEVDYNFDEVLRSDSEVAVSPHFQWNPAMDKDWGTYNVGFTLLKDEGFLSDWQELTRTREHKFEQVPIAKLLETDDYKFDIFPINYNMGWWRFNNQMSQFRLNSFTYGPEIRFDGYKVVCFHFHSFYPDPHSEEFFKKIAPCLSSHNLKGFAEEMTRIQHLTLS